MRPILKSEMFIYQLNANFNEKISFSEITHHLDLEIRKMMVQGMFGNKDSNLVHDLLAMLLKSKLHY